jgi:hypothetical protein
MIMPARPTHGNPLQPISAPMGVLTIARVTTTYNSGRRRTVHGLLLE